jgi:uncharacterized membrane protein
MQLFLKRVWSYFITGLIVVLVITAIVIILKQIFDWFELIIPATMGVRLSETGLGALIVILLIFLTGIFTRNYFEKKAVDIGNAVIVSIPLLNKVFITIQQIFNAMLKPQKNFLGEVVMIEYPSEGLWSLGFVTSRETSEISSAVDESLVCVYIPSTPNPASGVTIYVAESKLKPVELSPEIVAKASVSGGLVSSEKSEILHTTSVTLGEFIRKWKAHKNAKKSIVDPRD